MGNKQNQLVKYAKEIRTLRESGYSLNDVIRRLEKQYKLQISKSTLSRFCTRCAILKKMPEITSYNKESSTLLLQKILGNKTNLVSTKHYRKGSKLSPYIRRIAAYRKQGLNNTQITEKLLENEYIRVHRSSVSRICSSYKI